MQRRALGAVVALALVAATSACGGSGKKTSATATTAAQAPTTTTQPAGTTTAASSAGGGSFADAKNCAQLASLAAKVQKSVTPSGNGSVDLAHEAEALKTLADAAPSAIKGDFRTFAEAFASFARVYGDSGFKAGSTPTPQQLAKLTAASQKLATPKVQAAITHLESWGQAHCGGFTSTTP